MGDRPLSRGRSPVKYHRSGRFLTHPADLCLCISSVRESANATGDSVWWGVWLGRHICQRATQVSQGRLRQDGNPPSNRRAKAGSIGASSAGDDRESAAHRSFREFSSSGVWSERCQNSYLRGNWLVAAKRS